jgi:hypothetical protein
MMGLPPNMLGSTTMRSNRADYSMTLSFMLVCMHYTLFATVVLTRRREDTKTRGGEIEFQEQARSTMQLRNEPGCYRHCEERSNLGCTTTYTARRLLRSSQ